MTEISIIIPTYNSSKTIESTVATVQQQSFTDWEIIVIDDGSQDETVRVVKNIQEPRLQLFSYKNGGVAIARNRGIAKAKGNYLAFLDADDLWSREKLAAQIETLKLNSQAKVVYSWNNCIDEQGKFLFSGTEISYQGNVYSQLLKTNFISNGSNILIHRDALDIVRWFDPKLAYTADWDFYLRLAKAFDFAVVPQFQVFYRQSPNSMSSKIEELKQESLWFIEQIFANEASGLKQLKQQSCSNLYLYSADLYRKKISDDGKQNLANAIKDLYLSIWSFPRTLLSTDTQRLLLKLTLWQLYFIMPRHFLSQLKIKYLRK